MLFEAKATRALLTGPALCGWILAAIAVAIRVPLFVFPPTGGLINVDELMLALSVLDRWLGLPAVQLCWPGVPLQLATFLALLPQFLWALATDRSLDRLAHVVFSYYDDPRAVIVILRLLSSAGGVAAALGAFQLARRIAGNTIIGLLAGLLVTLLPLSLDLSLTGTTDALAFAFGIWAARYALDQPARPVLVGLLTAAAVATKAAGMVWLLPVFVAAAVVLWQSGGIRRLLHDALQAVVAGVIGLVLFYPYLWLAPVRAVKAIVGNALLHSNRNVPGMTVFSLQVPGTLAAAAVVVIVITLGVLALRSERWRYPGAALALSLAALFGFFIHIGFDYWRYAFGSLISFVALLAMASPYLRPRLALPVVGVVFVGFGIMIVQEQLSWRKERGYSDFASDVQALCRRGDTVWLPDLIIEARFGSLPFPKSTYQEIFSYMELGDRSGAVARWLKSAGLTPAAAVALQGDFDEDEQVALARLRGMLAVHEMPLNCPLHLYRLAGTPEASYQMPGGYLRGTYTDKSLSDVKASLANAGDKRVTVIGPAAYVASLNLPTRPFAVGWVAASNVAPDAR